MTKNLDSSISARFVHKENVEIVSQNERGLLRLIWLNPGISRTDVSDRLGQTLQSVCRTIDQLADRGVVLLDEAQPREGGHQSDPTLRINGKFGYSCGISLDVEEVGISIMDLSGKPLAHKAIALVGQSMPATLRDIRATVSNLTKRHGLSEEGLLGVGFAIAGNFVGGTRYNAPLPLHEWSLVELGPLLNTEFGKPFWMFNVAHTAAIAESMYGVGRKIRNFAYLSVSYGFGGALISNNELLQGSHRNAGEFSWVLEPHEVGQRPTLKGLIAKLRSNDIDIQSIDHLRRTFRSDWPGVEEWLDEIAPACNRVVNSICGVLDPQAIVIGGTGPQELCRMMIERTEFFDQPRYGVAHPVPNIIAGEMNANASAVGAAFVPLKEMIF